MREWSSDCRLDPLGGIRHLLKVKIRQPLKTKKKRKRQTKHLGKTKRVKEQRRYEERERRKADEGGSMS